MVAVVVRELGPLLTAMLVLARSGSSNVIELGTARALGEVEALEALRIDPIHYVVMPRVIGMALAVFALDQFTSSSAPWPAVISSPSSIISPCGPTNIFTN